MRNKRITAASLGTLIVLLSWLAIGCSAPAQQGQQLLAPIGSVPASQSKEYTLNVSEPVVLDFTDLAGSITLSAGQPGQLDVIVTKHTLGVDQQSAAADLESFEVAPQQKGKTIAFGLGNSGKPGRGADYKITTPTDTSFSLGSGSGDITLDGLKGDVTLKGQNLNVILSNIHGATSISSETGSVKITDGTGPVSIQSRTSSVDLNRVTGPSILVASGANTTAEDSGANTSATFRLPKGDLTLTRFRAQTLSANVPGGQIRVYDTTAQHMDLQTQDGFINLFQVNGGKLQATTTSGALTMDQVQGAFDIKTDKGAVNMTEIAATALNIAAGVGSVLFYGTLPTVGEQSIKTTSGNISIYVVKESAFRVDAATRGSITIQPPFVLESPNKTAGRWRGVINNGTILLAITSSSGNILISSEQPF